MTATARLIRLPFDILFLTVDFLALTLWLVLQLGAPIWGTRWPRFGTKADAAVIAVGSSRLRRCTLGRKYGNAFVLRSLLPGAFPVYRHNGRATWAWEQGAGEKPTTATRYTGVSLGLVLVWSALAATGLVVANRFPAVRQHLRQPLARLRHGSEAAKAGAKASVQVAMRVKGLCAEADDLFAKASYRDARAKYREALALDSGSVAAQLGNGLSALALGLDEEARVSLGTVLHDAPGNSRATWGMAQLAFRAGSYKVAVDILQHQLTAQPDDSAAEALLAESLGCLKEFDQALAVAGKGLDRKPGDAGLLLAAAKAHVGKEDLDAAERLYRQAMASGSRVADGQLGLAHVLRLRGRNDECEATLKAVLESVPDHPDAVMMLVDLWVARGQTAQALNLCTEVTQRQPQNYSLRERRGSLLLARGDGDGAYVSASALLRDQPGSPVAELQLATLFLAKGLPSPAIELCEKVVQQDAGLGEAHRLLAVAHMMRGETAEAMARLETILQAYPNDLESVVRLAECQARSGDPAKALATLEAVARRNPQSPIPYSEMGRHHYAAGHAQEALAAFRKAYELAPGEWTTCNNLAQMLASQNTDLDQALDLATKAFDQAPTNPSVADTLGWVYVAKGAYEKAAPLLTFAMVSLGSSAQVLYHVAELRSRVGDRESAVTLARRAVEIGPGDPDGDRAKALLARLSQPE